MFVWAGHVDSTRDLASEAPIGGLQRIGRAVGLGDRLAKAASVAASGESLLNTFMIAEEAFSPAELSRLLEAPTTSSRIDEAFGIGDWPIQAPVDQMLAVDYRTYLNDSAGILLHVLTKDCVERAGYVQYEQLRAPANGI